MASEAWLHSLQVCLRGRLISSFQAPRKVRVVLLLIASRLQERTWMTKIIPLMGSQSQDWKLLATAVSLRDKLQEDVVQTVRHT